MVVNCDVQRIKAVEVLIAGIIQRSKGRVHIGNRAGKGQRTVGPVRIALRQPCCVAQRQDTVSDLKRDRNLARIRIDIRYGNAAEGRRAVLVNIQPARDHRRVDIPARVAAHPGRVAAIGHGGLIFGQGVVEDPVIARCNPEIRLQ